MTKTAPKKDTKSTPPTSTPTQEAQLDTSNL